MTDPQKIDKKLLAFAYGGGQHVGGNKILIIPAVVSGNEIEFLKNDKGILIDFGKDFNIRKQFLMDPFEEYRKSSILYDAIFLGEIPPATIPLRGLYRSDLLKHGNDLLKDILNHESKNLLNHESEEKIKQSKGIRDSIFGLDGGPEGEDPITTPELIGGLLISHNHADHIGYIDLLHEDIPFYTSAAGMEMLSYMGKVSDYFDKDSIKFLSYLEEDTILRKNRPIRTLMEISTTPPVDSLEFTAIGDTLFSAAACPVDHSIPGACAFFIRYSGDKEVKKIVYTGDFREEGHMSDKSKLFIASVGKFQPDFIFCEGTKIGENPDFIFPNATSKDSESDVIECVKDELSKDPNNITFFDFRWNDFSRLISILIAANESNRTVVLTWKAYASLLALKNTAAIRSLFNPSIQARLDQILDNTDKNGLVKDVKVFLATRGYGDHTGSDYHSDKPFKYISNLVPLSRNQLTSAVGLTANDILNSKEDKFLVMITENQCPYLVEFFPSFLATNPKDAHTFLWLRYHFNDFDLKRLYDVTNKWCQRFNIAAPLVIHTSGHSKGEKIIEFLNNITNPKCTKILIHTEETKQINNVKFFLSNLSHTLDSEFKPITNPQYKVK